MRAQRLVRRALVLGVVLALVGGAPATASPDVTADDVLASPGVLVDPAVPPPPLPQAGAFVVADIDSGEVLAASNARTPLAAASTLKLLTALALAPGHADDEVYTATAGPPAVDGSKVGIVAGGQYRYADLLHALLMASGNDAAVAMAELAGGPEAATARMNEVAAGLGASDTLALNTSGLDAPGQVSSARDLALLARPVLDDERLAKVVVTPQYAFPGAGRGFGPDRPTFMIGNHNGLLGRYPGTIGLKNGYTEAARGSLVAAAERDGRRLVVVVLRAEGSEADQCAALLDWAFGLPATARPVTTLQVSVEASTASAAGPDAQRPPPAGAAAEGDGAAAVADRAAEGAVASTAAPRTSPVLVSALVLVGLLLAAVVVLRLTRDQRITRRRARRAARG